MERAGRYVRGRECTKGRRRAWEVARARFCTTESRSSAHKRKLRTGMKKEEKRDPGEKIPFYIFKGGRSRRAFQFSEIGLANLRESRRTRAASREIENMERFFTGDEEAAPNRYLRSSPESTKRSEEGSVQDLRGSTLRVSPSNHISLRTHKQHATLL